MPLYSFFCDVCGVEWDEFQKHDVRHVAVCPECGVVVKQRFKPFMFKFDFKPGWDPGLGEYVDTKKQREETVARNNLRRIKD
jgi:putative FmdB family regulatory protein